MSKERKSARSGTARAADHFHVLRVTSKKTIDVIAIVPLTAMPYADARRDDSLKPMTRAMHATMSPQLTSGT
jgi:hypothetical protein